MGKLSVGVISVGVGLFTGLHIYDSAISDEIKKNYTTKTKEMVRDSFEVSAKDYNKLELRLDQALKKENSGFNALKNSISWQEALDSLKTKKAYQEGFKAAIDSLKNSHKRIR